MMLSTPNWRMLAKMLVGCPKLVEWKLPHRRQRSEAKAHVRGLATEPIAEKVTSLV